MSNILSFFLRYLTIQMHFVFSILLDYVLFFNIVLLRLYYHNALIRLCEITAFSSFFLPLLLPFSSFISFSTLISTSFSTFICRYKTSYSTLGTMVFICNIVAGISALFAAKLADQIGLVMTMVVTHMPSNVLLILGKYSTVHIVY